MPALIRRRELFAQSVANGASLHKAALGAGYKPSAAQCTGSVLGKNPKVVARVVEIREAIARSMAEHSSYGLRQAMFEANQALEMAKANGNASHMVSAITLKARLAGLLVERASVTYQNVDELTDAQLETLIASAEGSADTDGLH